jgi:hypothetical protein
MDSNRLVEDENCCQRILHASRRMLCPVKFLKFFLANTATPAWPGGNKVTTLNRALPSVKSKTCLSERTFVIPAQNQLTVHTTLWLKPGRSLLNIGLSQHLALLLTCLADLLTKSSPFLPVSPRQITRMATNMEQHTRPSKRSHFCLKPRVRH